ncbi:hypothetical protein B0A48_08323 [Cryoendolithus antarcticus]|uniref:Uncharacterized protein n=1 Tax=Cryoendolithus antarcticus TaxID=1507870 RepID=A0A1V8T5B8_9PEZI|nr:hypothetical protein B0A48_08323 [Cryoendolithus antarcticus]
MLSKRQKDAARQANRGFATPGEIARQARDRARNIVRAEQRRQAADESGLSEARRKHKREFEADLAANLAVSAAFEQAELQEERQRILDAEFEAYVEAGAGAEQAAEEQSLIEAEREAEELRWAPGSDDEGYAAAELSEQARARSAMEPLAAAPDPKAIGYVETICNVLECLGPASAQAVVSHSLCMQYATARETFPLPPQSPDRSMLATADKIELIMGKLPFVFEIVGDLWQIKEGCSVSTSALQATLFADASLMRQNLDLRRAYNADITIVYVRHSSFGASARTAQALDNLNLSHGSNWDELRDNRGELFDDGAEWFKIPSTAQGLSEQFAGMGGWHPSPRDKTFNSRTLGTAIVAETLNKAGSPYRIVQSIFAVKKSEDFKWDFPSFLPSKGFTNLSTTFLRNAILTMAYSNGPRAQGSTYHELTEGWDGHTCNLECCKQLLQLYPGLDAYITVIVPADNASVMPWGDAFEIADDRAYATFRIRDLLASNPDVYH